MRTTLTARSKSLDKGIPIADTAAEIFYAKLFELDPSLRALFPSDMGERHCSYGVKDEHYKTVGTALIYTLGQDLGDAFTEDVKEAWIETHTILATTMKDAAKQKVA